MVVLRGNFMSKCYLIGRRLQTRRANPCTLRAMIRGDARKMCVFFMYFPPAGPVDHASAHDEFNGTRKVSPINRPIMITGFDGLRLTAALGAVGICAMSLIGARNAAADDASRWDGDARSAVRLIAGSAPRGEGPIRAGLEIRLNSGWHTYWRYPGDAGVPPRFDFSESENLKSVEVLWPAPQRIPEQGLVTIGYAGDVILPLAIVPQLGGEPAKPRIKLDTA